MRNYFQLADKSKDNIVSEHEATAFLEKINIKVKKDKLKALYKVNKPICWVFGFNNSINFVKESRCQS